MTHEEYVSRLESMPDAESGPVLAHVRSCGRCRAEQRFAETVLSDLLPTRRSPLIVTLECLAAAAVVLVIVGGMREMGRRDKPEVVRSVARYRVVGDSSGVVAYTPSGVVTGSVAAAADREAQR